MHVDVGYPQNESLTDLVPKQVERHPGAFQGFKVLLVDDDRQVVDLLSRVCSPVGCICATAQDGEQALESIRTDPPELVIADIRMPRLSGVGLAEAMRGLGLDIPIVFITGYAEYALLSQAIRMQPLGFLEKPFKPQELLTLLERAYHQKEFQKSQDEYRRQLELAVEERTRDIEFRTERLLAEKELLHGIIEQANFGLIAVDSFQCIHIVNEFAGTALSSPGVPLPLTTGQPLSSALSPELSVVFRELFDLAASRRERTWQEIAVPQTDRQVEIIAYPIVFRGVTTAIVFIVHDVTEMRRLQQRLIQSAKLASIGELAAGVAHEINNPLGFVISNNNTMRSYVKKLSEFFGNVTRLAESGTVQNLQVADMLRQALNDADLDYIVTDAQDLLSESADGLARVSQIVKDLKSFARIDADESAPGDVNELLEHALNLCRNETKYKLEIRRALGELPPVQCYSNQLIQVFTNIIINAVQAVPEKGSLFVSSKHVGNNIEVVFEDSGSGIPATIIDRIFDPFFTTKEVGKGTGMGLSISYGIIQKHGGTLTASSPSEEGARFTITLPLDGPLGSGDGNMDRNQP